MNSPGENERTERMGPGAKKSTFLRLNDALRASDEYSVSEALNKLRGSAGRKALAYL